MPSPETQLCSPYMCFMFGVYSIKKRGSAPVPRKVYVSSIHVLYVSCILHKRTRKRSRPPHRSCILPILSATPEGSRYPLHGLTQPAGAGVGGRQPPIAPTSPPSLFMTFPMTSPFPREPPPRSPPEPSTRPPPPEPRTYPTSGLRDQC